MNNDHKNDRRNFLKTAGAALVAVSVPAAAAAQNARPGGTTNNLKQIGIGCHSVAPNPNLPGVFALASVQLQIFADLGGGGYAVMSDPIVSEINSHIRILSAVQTSNTTFLLKGTIERSQSSELVGKEVVVRTQVFDGDGNCDLSLVIEPSAPTPINLLLPAVQKVREAARR